MFEMYLLYTQTKLKIVYILFAGKLPIFLKSNEIQRRTPEKLKLKFQIRFSGDKYRSIKHDILQIGVDSNQKHKLISQIVQEQAQGFSSAAVASSSSAVRKTRYPAVRPRTIATKTPPLNDMTANISKYPNPELNPNKIPVAIFAADHFPASVDFCPGFSGSSRSDF